MIEWIELLGIRTWETLWLPVAVWTIPAALVWTGVRSRRIPSGLRIQLVQAALLALPAALLVAAVRRATLSVEYAVLSVPMPAAIPTVPVVEQTVTRSIDPVWVGIGLLTIAATLAAAWGLMRFVAAMGALIVVRARSRPVSDSRVQDLLQRRADEIGIRRPVEIRTASGITTPMSAGVFSPVILIPEGCTDDLDLIVLHELIHHRRGDVARNVGARLIRAVFFIHPLTHALCGRLDALIEVDCDYTVISTRGVSRQAYASLLLRYAVSRRGIQNPADQLALRLSSDNSLIRKRLEAMKHPATTLTSHPIAALLGVVLLGAITAFAACTDSSVGTIDSSETEDSSESSTLAPKTDRAEKDVFLVVEQMPELIGGLEGLQSKLNYPDLARRAGIEGRVYVQFVVNTDGEPEDIIVVRGIGAGADEEAVRAVSEMRFTPGRQRGKIVPVKMSLPVDFTLDGRQLTDDRVSMVTRSGLVKMSGRVVDAAGDPVVFATIQLEGTIRGAATDRNGNYLVLAEPGTYDVRVVSQGSRERIEGVSLEKGVTKHLDVTLQK